MTAIPDQRADILAALRAIVLPGGARLHVHDSAPNILSPGTTYIRWRGSAAERSGDGPPGWWMDRWWIFIVQYGDDAVAETWVDTNLGAIVDGLQRVATFEAIEPVELAVESGKPPLAVRITVTRE
jgi:hypothetical protein